MKSIGLTSCLLLFALVMNSWGGESDTDKEKGDVDVVFHPDFDGRVVYQFYRDSNSTENVPQNQTEEVPQNHTKGVTKSSSAQTGATHGGKSTSSEEDTRHDNNGQTCDNCSNTVVLVVERPKQKLTITQGQFEVAKLEIERANYTGNATERLNEENSTAVETEVAKECISGKVCFGDAECATGRCLGLAVGKCNCGACLTFIACKDDSACGGLRGACNTESNSCDCERGFRANGFTTVFDAARLLCNVKDCTPGTDSCYGLPCNAGFCVC
ncbi:unnamed protein product [Toxocara canis]|uniref:Chondroitin proteoglycan 3 n=1 Tax=Toxocara canis TaxID=6265 RepID=A0A183V6G0_TOXCA|nr:unnamed protein product [Toxocara canis]